MYEALMAACGAVAGDQAALDSLYDFGADLFIGDVSTPCSWLLSDMLRCCATAVAILGGETGLLRGSVCMTIGVVAHASATPALSGLRLQHYMLSSHKLTAGNVVHHNLGNALRKEHPRAAAFRCRLPRVDYTTGAGGAISDATMYKLRVPLAYVPMFTSGLPPTGAASPIRTA